MEKKTEQSERGGKKKPSELYPCTMVQDLVREIRGKCEEITL